MRLPGTSTRPVTLVAALALAGAGIGAFAIAAHGDGGEHKDETFMTADTVGVVNVEGGDCFTDPTYDEAQQALIVDHQDCEAADNQAYGFFQIEGSEYDPAEVRRRGWDGCRTGFAYYWTSEEASGLAFYPVLPTRTSWTAAEDRTVMCVVYNPRGQLEGSPLPLA